MQCSQDDTNIFWRQHPSLRRQIHELVGRNIGENISDDLQWRFGGQHLNIFLSRARRRSIISCQINDVGGIRLAPAGKLDRAGTTARGDITACSARAGITACVSITGRAGIVAAAHSARRASVIAHAVNSGGTDGALTIA